MVMKKFAAFAVVAITAAFVIGFYGIGTKSISQDSCIQSHIAQDDIKIGWLEKYNADNGIIVGDMQNAFTTAGYVGEIIQECKV